MQVGLTNHTTKTVKRTWLFLTAALLVIALMLGNAFISNAVAVAAGQGAEQRSDKEKEKQRKAKDEDDDDDDKDDDDDDREQEDKNAARAEKEARKRQERELKKRAEEQAKMEKAQSVAKAKEEVEKAQTATRTREQKAQAARPVAEDKAGDTARSVKTSKAEAPKATAKSAAPASANGLEIVLATVETDPVPHGGDAADDPAIWVHPTNPAQSTIIGTDKQGGIAVYDLAGKQLQYLAAGLLDNVDLRQSFKLGGKTVALVTASNRKDNSIAIYTVNPETRQLEEAAARNIKHSIQIYGMCMYYSAKTDKTYYFGTSKSGDVEQFELFDAGNGKVDAKAVRKFKVGTVVEGCVADDELGHFYVSEEAVGIWKYGAEPNAGEQRTQVDKVGSGHLHADVEGLAIAYGPNGTGHLLVSSQGNHSYVVYKREGDNAYVKKFRIGDGALDGAEETDGIDVCTANFGDKFPQGLFVVQDGFNDKGSKNQNFKLVPLQAIIK